MRPTINKAVEAQAAQAGRREQILDAAEACFVRNGFHRTSMQNLAGEAGMSPSNFYHYFNSKEDIVLALAERDRGRAAAFLEEIERTGDRRATFRNILRRVLSEHKRDVAVLRVEVWAEAKRSPAIAAMISRSAVDARAWFCQVFATLATSPACNPAALFETVDLLIKGIIVNCAVLPGYDPADAVTRLIAIIDAGLDGHLPHPTHGTEMPS